MNGSSEKNEKTELRLELSFTELCKKKNRYKISVKDICDTAGVNRSTFYRHFSAIGDLENRITEKLTDGVLKNVLPILYRGRLSPADIRESMLGTVRFLRDNRELALPMLRDIEAPFALQYRTIVREGLRASYRRATNGLTAEQEQYCACMAVAAVWNVASWLENPTMTDTEFAAFIAKMYQTMLD